MVGSGIGRVNEPSLALLPAYGGAPPVWALRDYGMGRSGLSASANLRHQRCALAMLMLICIEYSFYPCRE